jgi:hypothetical protein
MGCCKFRHDLAASVAPGTLRSCDPWLFGWPTNGNFPERRMNAIQMVEKRQDENWCVFYRQKQGNKDDMFFVCN